MSNLEHWDTRYKEGQTPWDTGRPSSELVRTLAQESVAPCRAIELGCGTGTNAIWLAQQGFDVSAVDISPLAIARARERASSAGVSVRFIEADLLRPPDLGGPYGFFFDRGCYHVVRRTDVSEYLNTLDQLFEAGAYGLVLTGNARERHEPGPPVLEESDLRAELGRLFEIVWLREFRFDEVQAVGFRFLGWSCFLRRP
jgi:SAM-dependent methyltransferase